MFTRRNPQLVRELIECRWDMPRREFAQKYRSLCAADRAEVDAAIDFLDEELLDED